MVVLGALTVSRLPLDRFAFLDVAAFFAMRHLLSLVKSIRCATELQDF
jgi:hypothetical protein